MKKLHIASLLLSTAIIGTQLGIARAADIETVETPARAVSYVNGKIEVDAGYADIDGLDGDFAGDIGASLSFPIGDDFGIQVDAGVAEAFSDEIYGGALHLFTRDPASYLLGVTGGIATNDDATIWAVGPEVEFYLDNISLEAWAGYSSTEIDDGDDDDGFFGFVDLALYATDDFRLSVGASSVSDFESARAGFEYLLSGLPLSLTGTFRYGEDDFISATGGIKFYFGGDEGKSLIARHRGDDPRNRVLDIFGGTGNGGAFDDGGDDDPPPPPCVGECPIGEPA